MYSKFLVGLCLVLPLAARSQFRDRKIIGLSLDSAEFYQVIDFDRSILWADKAETAIHLDGSNSLAPLLLRSYRIRILSCFYFGRLKQCAQFIEASHLLIENFKNEPGIDYEISKVENELSRAKLLYEMDDFSKSLSLFTASFQSLNKLPRSARICGDLFAGAQYVASIHNAQGEYEASINQYLATISYYECSKEGTNANQSYFYALTFRNIGQTYLGKRDYASAKAYLDKAEDSLKSPLSKSPAQFATLAITLCETFASYYRAVGKNDSSRIAFLKAVPLLQYSEPFRGRVYLGLGEAYEGIEKFDVAKKYYSIAEAFFRKSFGTKNIWLSKTYLAMGRLNERQSKFDMALEFFQKSIGSLVLNFEPELQNNPTLSNILSKKQLFLCLQMKSHLLEKLSRLGSNTIFLQDARQTNRLSLALLDSTSNEFSLNSDKVILAEQSFGAFEDGIKMAYALFNQTRDEHYFDECFSLADKSKGIVLLENLRLVNRYAGVDPELIDQEKEIRSELMQTEQVLYREEIKGRESKELLSIRERYATLKQAYGEWIDKIKKEAPSYYQLRFDHEAIAPKQIQKDLLQNGEALIEYFVGDSAITIFGFTNSHKFVVEKKLPPEFIARVNHLRNLLTTAEYTRPKKDFEESSGYFYDLLLSDCLRGLGSGITALTIIPDGILGYVPFEILINTGAENPRYLTTDFSIRYAYSASYLREQLQKKTSDAKYFFAGFVSTGEEGPAAKPSLGVLSGAQAEVTSIVNLLRGDFTVYNPATKNDFLSYASNFKVLHLAMHSQVNDQNPMLSELVFSSDKDAMIADNRLTAIELYNFQLKADMVVLSACNTGFGQIHRGEGIMSLSRAFAYAGVPSALISLWQVPDKATSKIMINYYEYLSQGLPKDRALQLAKGDFVRNYPQMAEPFYWSGFILAGNTGPLQFPASTAWRWFVLSTLMLVAIAVVVRNRIRKKNAVNNISSV